MSDIEKMLDDLCSNMRKGLPVGAPRAAIVAEFERLTKERDAWMDTAATHLTNETFYRDIVQSIGALFPSCYVSDDGSVQDEPLALKVKECVVRELESDKALLAQRDARIAELEAGARVPGMMRCAKCEFVLTRTNLYVNQGTTGPGSSETEPCPNGCGPLWPMTWRDYATGMDKTVMRYLDERDEARAALAERDAALTKETTLCHRMIDERDHYREKAHSAEKELAERDARIAELKCKIAGWAEDLKWADGLCTTVEAMREEGLTTGDDCA